MGNHGIRGDRRFGGTKSEAPDPRHAVPLYAPGFYKVSFLVKAKEGSDFEQYYANWLNTHVPNEKSMMDEVGGFRYVVSHSVDTAAEPYAGLTDAVLGAVAAPD